MQNYFAQSLCETNVSMISVIRTKSFKDVMCWNAHPHHYVGLVSDNPIVLRRVVVIFGVLAAGSRPHGPALDTAHDALTHRHGPKALWVPPARQRPLDTCIELARHAHATAHCSTLPSRRGMKRQAGVDVTQQLLDRHLVGVLDAGEIFIHLWFLWKVFNA